MRVYVAIGGHSYEGYELPLGVFSTLDAAIEAFDADRWYDSRNVVTYDMDRPNEVDIIDCWKQWVKRYEDREKIARHQS